MKGYTRESVCTQGCAGKGVCVPVHMGPRAPSRWEEPVGMGSSLSLDSEVAVTGSLTFRQAWQSADV